jgi:hypothetical protein
MTREAPTVFFWGHREQEKTLVAASASVDAVEIYYALEDRCSRHGSSCTVSSHTWFRDARRYLVEEVYESRSSGRTGLGN